MKQNIDAIEVVMTSNYKSLCETIDLVTSKKHIAKFGAMSEYDLDLMVTARDDLRGSLHKSNPFLLTN